ncbi:uncharacterized protein [Paralichthys olivaceus]|uniref:uncharacterized protein n=1 Tax=Paralichthys olivaceus TaxID=8255 RepID=UPI00097D7252|nr:PREDICTED: uncharacterized protein LOC109628820 [Paralichthys olivaceus]
MLTLQFFLGASLWALLIVDMCCGPVKKGFNPGASSRGSYMYPSPHSNQRVPSSLYSPGNVPEGAYPEEDAAPSLPMSEPEPELAASAGSGSSSRPVQFTGSAARRNPAGPTQSGAGVQSAPKEINWLVAPPVFGDEETPDVESSSEIYVSPPLRPAYQAGELSHYEKSTESGNYQSETEEQASLPPPPEPKYAYMIPLPRDESREESYISPPQPGIGPARGWIVYPYYDYRFLTGNYPTGTFSQFSSSFEQGNDNWKDAHYVRDYLPYRAPSQLVNTPTEFEAPLTTEALKAPAKGVSKRGGAAAAVRSASSRKTAMRPPFERYG